MRLTLLIVALVLSPAISFCQSGDQILDQLWCFERNFTHPISIGDTLEVQSFAVDSSPIEFFVNGKFKRIKAPFRSCGNAPKPKPIDKLKGSWTLDNDVLSMITKRKAIKCTVVSITDRILILKVESISSPK